MITAAIMIMALIGIVAAIGPWGILIYLVLSFPIFMLAIFVAEAITRGKK
jgi:hypothetical protein